MPEQGLAAWMAIGIILGIGAKIVSGGIDMSGWLATLVTGITGALVGGWVTHAVMGWSDDDGHYALFAATVGGVFVLWVLDTLVPRRRY